MSRSVGIVGWPDFWDFVKEVGEKPTERHRLRRRDESNPWGPTNWYWKEPLPDYDRESRAAYMRAWYAANPVKKKKNDLKKLYGITIAEYVEFLREQDGKCAICGQEDEHFNLAVDHCHGSKVVRGLLCSLCNRGIGMFRDSPDLLMKASEYLKRPKRLV